MHFYIVTGIILLFYLFYPRSKWEAAVMLFVAFIPQGAILGEGQQFIGVMDHRSVVSLIVIFTALTKKSILLNTIKSDKYKFFAFFLLIFLMLILPRYIEIKDYLLYGGFDILTQIKRFVRDAIFVFVVYLIMQRMYDYRTLKGLEYGFLVGLVLSVGSMLFYDILLDLGFTMHKGFQTMEHEEKVRLTGFLGKDPNEASRLFNLVLAYILSKIEQRKSKLIDIIIIGLVIIGLLIFASKTGVVVMSLLILLFVFRGSKTSFKKVIFQSAIVIIMGWFLYNIYGGFLETRIEQQVSGEVDTFSGRQSYWILYLNDLIENPDYLIFGNLGPATYYRDVHNTYIWYLFYSGLISFSIIIFIFWRFYFYRKRYRSYFLYFSPLYTLIVLVVSWITGAGQLNYWFVLIMAASSGIPPEYYKLQTVFFNKMRHHK